MPIDVVCQCGKKLVAKDELAGKTVRCPQCKQPLVIRAPQAEPLAGGIGDLLDEEGYVAPPTAENACPSCGKEFRADAVICVHCGLDRRSGKKVAVTRIKEAPRPSLEVGSPYKSPQAGGAASGKRGSSSTEENLTIVEILFAILCTNIACILALIWLVMGNPKGKKMFVVVVIVYAVAIAIGVVIGLIQVAMEAGAQQ